jgi:hypothetical protein
MNWLLIGWIMIGVSVILMVIFTFLLKDKIIYAIRKFPQIEALESYRIKAIEGNLHRTLVLGHQLSSLAYPGLGLNSLAAVPGFLDQETLVDGKVNIASSEGLLLVFARQIIENRYQGGFSNELSASSVSPALFGPTPYTHTMGLLNALSTQPKHGLILTGNFGPEASLWSEICASKRGNVFASAGTIVSQATLYTHVKDLLVGAESFLLPGLLNPSPGKKAGWLTEDILRILLILILIVGAILKMVGVI